MFLLFLEASKKTVQEPLWKELGFTNREEFLVTEASMGNPWAKKALEKLRKEDNDLSLNIDNLKNKILYNKNNEI